MKKALSVLVIGILVLGAALADGTATGPETLKFTYTVEGFYNCVYFYKYNDAEGTEFDFGSSANGKIEAETTGKVVELYDKSFVNNGESGLTIKITFSKPTEWTLSTNNSTKGSQVNLAELTPETSVEGITSLTQNTEGDAKSLTIVYGAAPVDFTASGAEKKLAGLKFTWDEAVVPVGAYESTMTITYVAQ